MEDLHTNINNELFKKLLFNEMEYKLKENIKWGISDFDSLFTSYMNALLKTEFELFLKNSSNHISRNGYAIRTLKTTHGTIDIHIPRDRKGKFDSEILLKYSSCTKELATAIIKLYQLGLSTKDVASFVNDIYGVSYSKQSISSITQATDEIVNKFKFKKLDKRYIALFLDATYIPVKVASTFEKQAVHLVVGINQQGYQEIIGYVIGFKENNILWGEVLDDLKIRGVEEVDVFVSDGFVGIDKIIKMRYPESRIQRCTVHLIRNLMSKVSTKDTAAVIAEFKELFKMTDKKIYNIQLNYLKDKYVKYIGTIKQIFDNEYVTTYLDFPAYIHKTIKTTNRIESVNQKIKTRIRFKQNFPNVEALERMLVSSIIMQNNQSNKMICGIQDYINEKKIT